MFDIGFLELVVIMVLALLVLGPERLPGAAKSVGYWFGKARRYLEGMKSQVEAEFDTAEMKRLLHNQEIQLKELQSKLENGEGYIKDAFHDDPENSKTADAEIAAEEKPRAPQYDMIEEGDDRWDELEESNPVKTEAEKKSADIETENESDKQSAGKAQ